jgi:hypothetical protein
VTELRRPSVGISGRDVPLAVKPADQRRRTLRPLASKVAAWQEAFVDGPTSALNLVANQLVGKEKIGVI